MTVPGQEGGEESKGDKLPRIGGFLSTFMLSTAVFFFLFFSSSFPSFSRAVPPTLHPRLGGLSGRDMVGISPDSDPPLDQAIVPVDTVAIGDRGGSKINGLAGRNGEGNGRWFCRA